MTDEAQTVAVEAAPMPETQSETSAPVETASQPSETCDTSARGAIERAFEAMNKRDVEIDDGAEPAPTRERNPDGTFKAAEKTEPEKAAEKPAADAQQAATAVAEAPARFSADAKAAWATAPEPVKAEVTRAIRELESGIQQYQQAFEPYKDFDRQLKANGQTFKDVVDHYTGIENLLQESPLRGLDQICRNMGTSLEAVARHIMGQPEDQQAAQRDTYINELKAEIAELKNQVGGVTTTIRSQQEKALLDQVEAFASDPANTRFEELSNDIVFFLESGRAKNLKDAYDLAARLNPAPVAANPQPAATAATEQTAPSHTRKGQLSPSGAPSSGSNPAQRKPPASARDAIERAFAATGL